MEDIFEQDFSFCFVCLFSSGGGVGEEEMQLMLIHTCLKPDIPVPTTTTTTFSLQPFVSINNPIYENEISLVMSRKC